MGFAATSVGNDQKLFDQLVCGEITPAEFKNNSVIIEKFSETVDNVTKLSQGYALITVDIRNKRNIILVAVNATGYYRYNIYTKTIDIPIENPVSFKVHELKDDIDIQAEVDRIIGEFPYNVRRNDVMDVIVTDTLDGYRVNLLKMSPILELAKGQESIEITAKEEFSNIGSDSILQLHDSLLESIVVEKDRLRIKLMRFIESQKCPELKIGGTIVMTGVSTEEELGSYSRLCSMSISEIENVKNIGNTRYALIKRFNFYTSRNREISCMYQKVLIRAMPGTGRTYTPDKKEGGYYYTEHRGYSESWAIDSMPYNFIDTGRIFVSLSDGGSMRHLIISEDPRIIVDYRESMIEGIHKTIRSTIKENIAVDNIAINDPENKEATREMNLLKVAGKTKVDAQKFMQCIKILCDEYKYVVKRQKAEGSNVKITDNIIYNHTEATVSYNDFSIKVDEQAIKSALYSLCSEFAVEYYRGKKTEEQIIDGIMERIFQELKTKVEGWNLGGFPIHLKINNAVDINIERSGKNNFTYINGQRFNKNEVIPVIREITCYRDQEAADKFIKTIGKLGLSVYIGITTGYETNGRIYRFKKNKGRSRYTLIIDDVEIEIAGKKTLNFLYEITTGRRWANTNQLDEFVFKSAKTGYDYVKYRFLIESSYKVFMEKSKKFLGDKIKEVGGEEVWYYDPNRRKTLRGVYITGMSKKSYVVAYDSKESFVFLSPTVRAEKGNEEKRVFEKGTYICMIDQSSIKSNIGYDTVVSKLMSLKNDSIIASRIYNLEDELNK